MWPAGRFPIAISLLVALSVGTLAGLFNGIIITRFKVPPLIATLATLALYRGLAEGLVRLGQLEVIQSGFLLGQGEFFVYPHNYGL